MIPSRADVDQTQIVHRPDVVLINRQRAMVRLNRAVDVTYLVAGATQQTQSFVRGRLSSIQSENLYGGWTCVSLCLTQPSAVAE
jgi:hypothetical protein